MRSDYIEKIDNMGGMLRAIETGYVQREIQEAAYEYQKAVESNDAIIVGVNNFQTNATAPIPILRIDEQIERETDRTPSGPPCQSRCRKSGRIP
jgi:methylmalonyl-CoA mutase N-terminal domain/subunit